MIRTLAKWTAIAVIPGFAGVALAVWAYRRWTTNNRVIIVREPATRFVVYRGGRA